MTKPNVVLVTLDSCRLDSFQAASTPFMSSLGDVSEGRVSADWTLPSHVSMLSGNLPWAGHINRKSFRFPLWMPEEFQKAGYRTIGAAAMPWLNKSFKFDRGFDRYFDWKFESSKLYRPMESSITEIRLNLAPDGNFIFLNAGETHFPYSSNTSPFSGRLKEMVKDEPDIDPKVGEMMHRAQTAMVQRCDESLLELSKSLGENTIWFVTADHGELFGEHGKYLHGHGCYEEEVVVPVVCSDWGWWKKGEA